MRVDKAVQREYIFPVGRYATRIVESQSSRDPPYERSDVHPHIGSCMCVCVCVHVCCVHVSFQVCMHLHVLICIHVYGCLYNILTCALTVTSDIYMLCLCFM